MGVIPQVLHIQSKNIFLESIVEYWQVILPLVVFIWMLNSLVGTPLKTYFHKITKSDFWDGVLVLILDGIYSTVVSQLLTTYSSTTSNANDQGLNHISTIKMVLVFIVETISNAKTLLSEELLALIPMLVFATLANKYWHFSRDGALLLGTIISIFVFGFMHFSTYDWYWAQMIILIGGSRIFYNGVYIRTKNLWVSYLCHFLWDTITFAIVIVSVIVLHH